MKELDGICEECGNTGIVGDSCSFCGNRIVSLDEDLGEFDDEEEIAPKSKSKRASEDEYDELEEFGDLGDLEEDLESLDEEEDTATSGHESLDELASKEEREENMGADLAKLNEEEDSDE